MRRLTRNKNTGDLMKTTEYFFDTDTDVHSWREVALCNGTTEVSFFPMPDDLVGINAAKEVCRGCPVADECVQFALETNQPDGIWGGTTAKERSKLRREWLKELRKAS